MEVDVNGEARSTLSTLPLPVAEVSSPGKAEAEKPRCSSTPCSPMRRTVSGYQILHMDSNYLVGFTTGEELLKLAQKCTGGEESKGEAVPSLRSKQLDAGLARSSRLYKTRSRYYQPYEIPAVNGRRRRRMPSSGDKCTKSLPYEPYKALHGPLPLCLLKGWTYIIMDAPGRAWQAEHLLLLRPSDWEWNYTNLLSWDSSLQIAGCGTSQPS
ncbi:PREDICTED: UNC119-binding protein C5orf30 homolog isoform X1 [Myotis brandtii]|uniref:UNC119-binding protein C5orf30 homolog isoform X1 n=1 Tax=Myotis brandtii TaxID=109478 RepID=UPI0007047345|nr:PREDICTED: UNC119-binding protein C5orf30 homolog isoform X1 [Myotis brandtii]